MKAKYLVLSLFIASANLMNSAEPILLSSPVLKLVDGIKNVMDEKKVQKLIYMGQQLNKFQNGEIDIVAKKRAGQHAFNGKLYTLKELVEVEEKNKKAQNFNMAELNKSLNILKRKYLDLVRPFFIEARGSNTLMYKLIEESCQKRNRHNSLLLTWAPEDEEVSFKKNVKTVKSLDIFCSDLTNFLKDLIHSCPKAFKRYQDSLKAK